MHASNLCDFLKIYFTHPFYWSSSDFNLHLWELVIIFLEVDDGDTVMDYMKQVHNHGCELSLKILHYAIHGILTLRALLGFLLTHAYRVALVASS